MFSAATVLQETEAADLDEMVHYEAADLVSYSPVTEAHVESGMTLLEVLPRAAITVSDNTAANLLFERLGGPDTLEAALRAAGDDTTSVDRIEPELSDWTPGETRDTSTPRAMAENLKAFALGSGLDEEDRAILVAALRDNTTGDLLIPPVFPTGGWWATRQAPARTAAATTSPSSSGRTAPRSCSPSTATGWTPRPTRTLRSSPPPPRSRSTGYGVKAPFSGQVRAVGGPRATASGARPPWGLRGSPGGGQGGGAGPAVVGLARGGADDGVHQGEALGGLVAGEAVPAVGHQILQGDRHPRNRLDHRRDRTAPAIVFEPDDEAVDTAG